MWHRSLWFPSQKLDLHVLYYELHLATCELVVSWKFSLHTLFVPSFLLLSGNSYSTEQKNFKYSSNHIPINFVWKEMIGKDWIKTKVWIFCMASPQNTHTYTHNNNCLIMIPTHIYKMPFLAGAHSALQLHPQWQNTQAPQTHWIKHTMWHIVICDTYNLLITRTCTHTHTNQYHVGKRWLLRADLKEEADWESNFFWKCVQEYWSNVRERMFIIWLSLDRWYAQYIAVCRRLKFLSKSER